MQSFDGCFHVNTTKESYLQTRNLRSDGAGLGLEVVDALLGLSVELMYL
jgi:hypothetical protein